MIRSTSHRRGTGNALLAPVQLSTQHATFAGQRVETWADERALELSLDGQLRLRFLRRSRTPTRLGLSLEQGGARSDLEHALAALFGADHALRELELALPHADLADELFRSGLASSCATREGSVFVTLDRSMFFQRPAPFLGQTQEAFPLRYVLTGEKRHPLRPARREGVVYRRYIPALASTVSFRTLTSDDLEHFHRWMNDPRVSAFWELAGSREDHARYIETALLDPHLHPVIGLFDDEPFGYFELYWAKEDRIAPFYDARDHDRGLHMLVGEPRFRGPARVAAWLTSLVHFLFLDDPRTEHVVAEPRADNQKMIDYLGQAGFFLQKEFDFPHKRAAMMIVPRETFFVQHGP